MTRACGCSPAHGVDCPACDGTHAELGTTVLEPALAWPGDATDPWLNPLASTVPPPF